MYYKRLDMLGRLALFAVVLLWAQGSSASMIVYEPFDYADGSNLGGQSPDAGTHTWAQADTANASVDTKATSPGLSMPAYMAPAQGNKATYGAGTTSDRINLNGGITTGSTYYSFLLKVTDLGTLPTLNSGSGGNQILAGFNNSVGTQGPNPTNISSTIWAKPGPTGTGTGNDPNHYQLGMSVSAATTSRQYGSATYATTDTLFVVGQFQFGADTTYANANGNLWVYDLTAGDTVPFTPGTPTASPVGTGLSGSASLASFLLYSTAANTSNRFGVNGINVDEVRVGNSWNDVVVPEPSMLALIGLGMMGLFSLRLRNA